MFKEFVRYDFQSPMKLPGPYIPISNLGFMLLAEHGVS